MSTAIKKTIESSAAAAWKPKVLMFTVGVIVAMLLVPIQGAAKPVPIMSQSAPNLGSVHFMIAAFNVYQVKDIISNFAPYIRSGDSFDLIAWSNPNVINLDHSAALLHAKFPDSKIYVTTNTWANAGYLAGHLNRTLIKGVFYGYEIDQNANSGDGASFNWTKTQSILKKASTTMLTSGSSKMQTGAYITGRGVFAQYPVQLRYWNYATIGKPFNNQVVETQSFCKNSENNPNGAESFNAAVTKIMGQYKKAGVSTSNLWFQISLGNPGGNAASNTGALACTKNAVKAGDSNIYVWWALSYESNTIAYLKSVRGTS